MPRYRAKLRGAPVLLLDVDTQGINRLGFYTTRWVQAASAAEAGALAGQMVLAELATTGTKNPPDDPIRVSVEDAAQVSWFEMARRGPGCGFTFYLDDADG